VTGARETGSAKAALAHAYAPAPRIRVGILLVAGAMSEAGSAQAVDDALMAAGHTALRRCARLQPRPGESDLRVDDVLGFLALYGHEYATVAFRPWPAARGHENDLIAAARRAGCRTIWETGPDDASAPGVAAGAEILLRRSPG